MRALWLLLLLVIASCAASRPQPPSASVVTVPAAPPPVTAAEVAVAPESPASSVRVPVTADDALRGSPTAPVTIVEMADLQCPFCARVQPTLSQLMLEYGPERLRLVFKHNPLAFHKQARDAANWAEAVRLTHGNDAFFAFVARAFAEQKRFAEPDAFAVIIREIGLDAAAVRRELGAGRAAAKVAGDMQLAAALNQRGTPAFLINGVVVPGAQPIDSFRPVIDAELQATALLAARGVPPDRVYAERVQANLETKPEAAPAAATEDADRTNWKVPIAGAPAQGPADALITIVEFYDYQCPFCKRVQPTIDALMQRYAGQIRLVVRHNPLAFHPRARPAAELAVEARAQRGDAAFFEISRRIFESQQDLSDAALRRIAQEQKLDVARAMAALRKHKHAAALEDDMDLAEALEARGTPQFFVNGRRISGAQPLEKFVDAIEEQLMAARKLRAQGVRDVYTELMKLAKDPPGAAADIKTLPAPTAAQPSRGPLNAKIVIQMFAGFQCPFSKRALPALRALERQFPGKLRIVWRNMPLPFHKHGRRAAAAALEAHALGGNAAFWKMHDQLFEHQAEHDAFDDAKLRTYAKRAGVNADRIVAAANDGRHDAAIDADVKLAQDNSISGTPGFVINDRYLSGVQPERTFVRIIRELLK